MQFREATESDAEAIAATFDGNNALPLEPRVRAVFLQSLFDHANIGGFDGVFTSGESLLALRRTLKEVALPVVGEALRDVLITELLRQES